MWYVCHYTIIEPKTMDTVPYYLDDLNLLNHPTASDCRQFQAFLPGRVCDRARASGRPEIEDKW